MGIKTQRKKKKHFKSFQFEFKEYFINFTNLIDIYNRLIQFHINWLRCKFHHVIKNKK